MVEENARDVPAWSSRNSRDPTMIYVETPKSDPGRTPVHLERPSLAPGRPGKNQRKLGKHVSWLTTFIVRMAGCISICVKSVTNGLFREDGRQRRFDTPPRSRAPRHLSAK